MGWADRGTWSKLEGRIGACEHEKSACTRNGGEGEPSAASEPDQPSNQGGPRTPERGDQPARKRGGVPARAAGRTAPYVCERTRRPSPLLPGPRGVGRVGLEWGKSRASAERSGPRCWTRGHCSRSSTSGCCSRRPPDRGKNVMIRGRYAALARAVETKNLGTSGEVPRFVPAWLPS